jgi:hypothetical protein
VGNAEAVQDAVQAVGELLIQRVVQVGTTTAVLGYSRAGSVWYVTQVAASSTTACAGAEELPWGGGRLIIVTAVYGSQSGPRGGSSSGVDPAAIAPEHACRLIATFDPSEVRTVIHVLTAPPGRLVPPVRKGSMEIGPRTPTEAARSATPAVFGPARLARMGSVWPIRRLPCRECRSRTRVL